MIKMVIPVDLQHIMLKSGAAEKWQHAVQQQQEITRMEFTLESLKETDIDKERVKYLESKEEVKDREEGEERRSGEHYENLGKQVDTRPEEEKQNTDDNKIEKEHQINILV